MNHVVPLERIRIVLCAPSHPGNIGASARAMKTMGLKDLRLVQPRHFPHAEANARASAAEDVLENAKVCNDLSQALRGTVVAIGCSARRRDLSHRELSFKEVAKLVADQFRGEEVAIVFGTEMSGLTTEELNKCQYIAYIPTDPVYSSLNLAAAVQVMAYELRSAMSSSNERPMRVQQLAKHEELELLYREFECKMVQTGFLDPTQPKRLMQRIRRMFARIQLEKEEINILRGFLNAIGGSNRKQ